MKKTVIFEGGVNKVSTLADGTLSINIHTQELPEETMMRVFSLRKSPGMVLISSDDISKAEVEEVEKFTTDFEVGKTKTASQRLRAVLYRVWEQSEQAYDFPIWYESQMERIIEIWKRTKNGLKLVLPKKIKTDIGFQLMFGHREDYRVEEKRIEDNANRYQAKTYLSIEDFKQHI